MRKLTESQAESLELLYANICNGLIYSEDLLKTDLREVMSPIVTKFRWLKTAIELKMPTERRRIAQAKDNLFFDELLRCATHMTDNQKSKLEKFINEL